MEITFVLPLITSMALLVQQGGPTVELELRQRTQELLDAVAPGNDAVWRHLLHDQIIHVDENGVVRTKEQLLGELRPLPAGLQGTLRVVSFQVHIHGDAATATHEDHEELSYFGQILRSRFRTTDTWLRTPDGWRLIAAQVLAVPADPPAITLNSENAVRVRRSVRLDTGGDCDGPMSQQ